MSVEIIDEEARLEAEANQLLIDILEFAAKKHGVVADREITVLISSDEQIKELNRIYRGKNSPTDVLSFAYDEADGPEYDSEFVAPLGDIIISSDRVLEQAADFGHSVKRELCYLVVHGFLHLIGYDHINEEDRIAMREEEEKLMIAFDLQLDKVEVAGD